MAVKIVDDVLITGKRNEVENFISFIKLQYKLGNVVFGSGSLLLMGFKYFKTLIRKLGFMVMKVGITKLLSNRLTPFQTNVCRSESSRTEVFRICTKLNWIVGDKHLLTPQLLLQLSIATRLKPCIARSYLSDKCFESTKETWNIDKLLQAYERRT